MPTSSVNLPIRPKHSYWNVKMNEKLLSFYCTMITSSIHSDYRMPTPSRAIPIKFQQQLL